MTDLLLLSPTWVRTNNQSNRIWLTYCYLCLKRTNQSNKTALLPGRAYVRPKIGTQIYNSSSRLLISLLRGGWGSGFVEVNTSPVFTTSKTEEARLSLFACPAVPSVICVRVYHEMMMVVVFVFVCCCAIWFLSTWVLRWYGFFTTAPSGVPPVVLSLSFAVFCSARLFFAYLLRVALSLPVIPMWYDVICLLLWHDLTFVYCCIMWRGIFFCALPEWQKKIFINKRHKNKTSTHARAHRRWFPFFFVSLGVCCCRAHHGVGLVW